MSDLTIGDIVLANYNSGLYIGKLEEDRRNFLLVEVLAVKKHPTQGDLHNPGKVEGVAFFERKALAYKEKMNVQKRKVQPYNGDVPNYSDSLRKAIYNLKIELSSEDTLYNKKAMEKLIGLEEHYYNKTGY